MRNAKRLRLAPLALVLVASFVASPGHAQTPFFGSRATGMAGAATAAVDDGMALWINPAGLALSERRFDVEVYGSAVATDNGKLRHEAAGLSGADLGAAASDPSDRLGLIQRLGPLTEPGTGVVGSGSVGVGVSWGGFSLGIDDTAYSGVYPFVDLTHLGPAGDPTSIAENGTAIRSAGLQAREARLGLSRAFFHKLLQLGVTLRYVDGRTTYDSQSIFTVDFGNPITVARQALTANPLDTSRFTFDAGAIVNLFDVAHVGIVSTAITQPSFPVQQNPANPELAGAPASLTLPRTLRAGASVTAIGIVTVAVDGDLIRTKTLVPGGESQQLSGGIEVRLPLFSLRGGAFYDFAAVDPHWAYSAGFGLDLPFVSIAGALVLSTYQGLSLSSANQRDLGAALSGRVRF